MKRIISFCLMLTMIVCFIPVSPSAAEIKDGYSLAPILYGKSGVDASSSYTLTTPDAMTLEAVTTMMSIDDQPLPVITQVSDKEFSITPAVSFSNNSLYIFRLSRDGMEDITWAFQTSKKFEITSNFPGDIVTNIPVNSGIEITFSYDDYTPIDDLFSIYPSVEGKFEYHKNTAVFVPNSLNYETVYTVTIKAGVKSNDTGEEILSDYTFEFETESETEIILEDKASTYFHSKYVELPTIEQPSVVFRIYHKDDTPMPNSKINVYKLGSDEKAIEYIKTLTSIPDWSYYAKEKNLIDTTELTNVMSFDAKDSYDDDYARLTFPNKLSQGFYLVDSILNDSRDQMIIQINDLPVQVIADSDSAILWVNDISTTKGAKNAKVYDVKADRTYTTDDQGIVLIDRALQDDSNEQFNITASNGNKCIWINNPSSYYYGYYNGYNTDDGSRNYWTNLQLDRTLFKSDDIVSFWGFAQNRKNNEEIKNVTATITQGYGYPSYGDYDDRDILSKQIVPVENSNYSDEIKLPNLDSGSYCLSIHYGDIVLGSTYFSIEDYVKPPYKMEITSDKKAVFAGETVNFTTKVGFFEGTPVSDLDISYNMYDYNLITPDKAQAKTDINGEIEVPVKIEPKDSAQGQNDLHFRAEATLPEIGQTYENAYVRTFINDIDVKTEAKRTGAEANIKVDVNSITLDRLNEGTSKDYNDYIDEAVSNKAMSVEIYRVYWVAEEDGKYYDYIEKKNVAKYKYTRQEEVIDSFELSTNNEGIAEKQITIPNRECESYFARVTCVDGKGRQIKNDTYIGRDYSGYYRNVNENNYYLDDTKDSYDVGEEVSLELKIGADTVKKGNILFVSMQNGILSYQAGKNPYTFEFSAENIPNTTVTAYYFNGFNYQSGYNMSKNIEYNYSNNDLTISAVTDKESYSPGDTCNIIVTAKDKDGAIKEANVNISIVDEALFALRNYNIDTLESLYKNLDSGLKFAKSTHKTFVSQNGFTNNEGAIVGPSGGGGSSANSADKAVLSAAESLDSDETYLRETFKDTAFFSTIKTNEKGEAVYSFKLPDNITSWRLTMSGISEDLYAGSAVQNINVTNPMFINYTFNDEFLIGDMPMVGVNVYGTSLSGGEVVDFEIWNENTPDVKYTASGTSFERVNIPLWEMTDEGQGLLVIKATVNNGTSDMVKHEYTVLNSNREIDTAMYYDVTTDTVFDVAEGGLTNITFTDRGRGQYLCQLIGMRYSDGDRIEKMVARREANRLIETYFPDMNLYTGNDSFKPKEYQSFDGGIETFPYAESDLEITIKLMQYIKEDIDIMALRNYFYNIYEGENSENKMAALYGLAMLKEPILLDLDNYSMLENISTKDLTYIALSYCALGENQVAETLYDTRIAPNLEQIAPYYRVNVGVDNDDVLEATSAVCMLASALEKPEHEGLYQYCINNYTRDILTNIEKLTYITNEIEKKTDVSGSIKYTLFGEEYTRDIGYGRGYTLKIPAQSIQEFKLLEVSGDVGAVSAVKMPMTDIGAVDETISVRRRFYKANEYENSSYTFEQGDLVRVQVWIDYSAKSANGSYCITDYLPSGLEYVSNSAKIEDRSSFGFRQSSYAKVEGQKVMFYDYNRYFDCGSLYYYYARVVSPGAYKAEGTLLQNLTAKELFTLGQDDIITIQ